ncbi:MAG UNVERIFIED_CONTAM: hypothetical protein LVQ98_02670 [Rickettsiaceae bacterium]
MNNILKIVAVGLLLTGCASHPKMTTFTPASVVVDYSGNDLYEATRLAQQYCQSVGKDAQYVRTENGGFFDTTKEAFFNCVESSSSRNNGNNNGGSSQQQMPMPIINNFK